MEIMIGGTRYEVTTPARAGDSLPAASGGGGGSASRNGHIGGGGGGGSGSFPQGPTAKQLAKRALQGLTNAHSMLRWLRGISAVEAQAEADKQHVRALRIERTWRRIIGDSTVIPRETPDIPQSHTRMDGHKWRERERARYLNQAAAYQKAWDEYRVALANYYGDHKNWKRGFVVECVCSHPVHKELIIGQLYRISSKTGDWLRVKGQNGVYNTESFRFASTGDEAEAEQQENSKKPNISESAYADHGWSMKTGIEAYITINRHAEDWGDIDVMMEAWRVAVTSKLVGNPSAECVKPARVMTLDDAIAHAKARSDDSPCGREHRQLAAWLVELKDYRETIAFEMAKIRQRGSGNESRS